ncbi:Cro/C1-type protein [Bacillus phage vB_BmeM-Goe8]|uniref:Cro/C1-type protein n=1 Tax=Bacillus phage vB_BmeM-Goe8 TaxID=2593638 RepID=A0A516KN16_9CAUD|nr:Cro/C1-type protein [Bacillus phage vB_BmeM-Goe8]QDP42970.1 Cro/C1-type protein [Bacillus phage vB_BmeM-Goe8]
MAERTYTFRIKLKEALEEANMNQSELAELTGLRRATISEIAQNSRTVMNKSHLGKIMDALDLKDINDILELIIEETL